MGKKTERTGHTVDCRLCTDGCKVVLLLIFENTCLPVIEGKLCVIVIMMQRIHECTTGIKTANCFIPFSCYQLNFLFITDDS